MTHPQRELDVAVIIVSFRSAQLAVAALRSVQAERKTAPAWLRIRAIVVDNASGDLPQIEAATREHGWQTWVTPVLAPRNGGFAYGNNFGIGCAYAQKPPDYVYLLNPDAEVRGRAVETLARFLEMRPDVGIAGSSFENLDGSAWPMAFRFPTLLSELAQGLELGIVARLLNQWVVARQMSQTTAQPVDWICGASMLIRPAVLRATGGLDENYFLYYEETDFCLRAKRAGFATWYVPESRVMHIAGQSTKVTELSDVPRRMPSYWFESRRRYFAVTFGVPRAMLIDVVAVVAHSLGLAKRLAARRQPIPHFIRDLIRHSILRSRNRGLAAVRAGAPRT